MRRAEHVRTEHGFRGENVRRAEHTCSEVNTEKIKEIAVGIIEVRDRRVGDHRLQILGNSQLKMISPFSIFKKYENCYQSVK